MYLHGFARLAWTFCCLAPGVMLAGSDSPEPLTRGQALRLAVENDPVLAVNRLETEAAEGQVEQAGLRPNPIIGVEVENFLGTGPYREGESVETTIGVRQAIETAGKRAKRTALARHERSLIEWERERRLAELDEIVAERFTGVLLAQEQVKLAQELKSLAVRAAVEVEERVQAARASGLAAARARLAAAQSQFGVQQAEQALESARLRLALLWGASEAQFPEVAGELAVTDVPGLEELLARLPETAALRRFEGERKVRRAAADLEKARATPDFELFGGARYLHEGDGEGMFVLGVEMPWALFDRNQGNVRSARAHVLAVDHEEERVRRELVDALAGAHHAMTAARADLRTLDEQLLPRAQEAVCSTQEAYERGQFTVLDVLESRRAHVEIRISRIEALGRFLKARARVGALTRPANK